MSVVQPAIEMQQPTPVPGLLVELPSRPRVFFGNLRDLIFPRRQAPLELQSAPAAFWPDVFVQRRFPWDGFLQSGAYHLVAFGILLGISRLLALQPRVETRPTFNHSEVVYYQPSEYLHRSIRAALRPRHPRRQIPYSHPSQSFRFHPRRITTSKRSSRHRRSSLSRMCRCQILWLGRMLSRSRGSRFLRPR